jgi:hypothetical protein
MAEIGGGLGGGDGEALDGAAVGEGMEMWTVCCFHWDGGEEREEGRVAIKLILDQWT